MEEPNFSLSNFRKWMSKQKNGSKLKGSFVESKLNLKTLTSHMDIDQGYLQEMAKDFKKNGGVILECDKDILLIEVGSGTFRIAKVFVEVIK